ncbi:MAG: hypothetical protein JXA41_11990 [Deltaproteobacteria bacterium]|nr:hypothetical protein [Deltaproteobacteria bacterium]
MDVCDYISTWSVLKWIVLVLVAGFIGQFGRMTAQAVVARIKLRRAKKQSSSDAVVTSSIDKNASLRKTKTAATSSPSAPPENPLDEKTLKTFAKIRKKEIKARSKAKKKQ